MPGPRAAGVAVGIDAGSTSTRGVLVDAAGTELARSSAGGANVRMMSATVVAQVMAAVLAPLLEGGGVRAVCVGAAGAGRAGDRDALAELLRGLVPAEVKLIVCNDAQIALRAATASRPAMVVIAGTGSIAYGERAGGGEARAGGYGAVIGDDGSGYAIGIAAIRHAARALDGIDAGGMLASTVAARLDAKSSSDLIDRVQRWPPDVSAISQLAAAVGEAAASGDAAAEEIVSFQARALATAAAHVARVVRADPVAPDQMELPVALGGGTFEAIPVLVDVVGRAVERTGPCAVTRLATPPAMGAALIALDASHE